MRQTRIVPVLAVPLMLASLGAAPARAECLTIPVTAAEAVEAPQIQGFAVNLRLSTAGQKAVARFTTRHVGQVIDVSLDGVILTSPRIQAPLTGSSLQLNRETEREARDLAARLSSGKAALGFSRHGAPGCSRR